MIKIDFGIKDENNNKCCERKIFNFTKAALFSFCSTNILEIANDRREKYINKLLEDKRNEYKRELSSKYNYSNFSQEYLFEICSNVYNDVIKDNFPEEGKEKFISLYDRLKRIYYYLFIYNDFDNRNLKNVKNYIKEMDEQYITFLKILNIIRSNNKDLIINYINYISFLDEEIEKIEKNKEDKIQGLKNAIFENKKMLFSIAVISISLNAVYNMANLLLVKR